MGKHFSELDLLLEATCTIHQGTLVDVGAHVGSTAGPFAQRGWNIIAFEPEPKNYQELTAKFGTNPNVRCIPKAVSDQAGEEIPFFISDKHWGIHSLKPFHPSHECELMVETVRLDQILPELSVDEVTILKIDIEGADFLALRSFDFERCQPQVVMTEYMDERSQPNFGYTHHDVVEFMAEHGYTAFISEWAPITEYSQKDKPSQRHTFLRCQKYPLAHEPVWGNLIFVPEDDAAIFNDLLEDYLWGIGANGIMANAKENIASQNLRTPWRESSYKTSYILNSVKPSQYLSTALRKLEPLKRDDEEFIVVYAGEDEISILQETHTWVSKWIVEPDRGEAHGVNKGILLSKGKIIRYLSDDDTYFPEVIHEANDLCLDQDLDAVFMAGESVNNVTGVITKHSGRLNDILRYQNTCGLSVCFRASLIPLLGLFDVRYIHLDNDFITRLIRSGAKIDSIDKVGFKREQTSQSNATRHRKKLAWERASMILSNADLRIDAEDIPLTLIDNIHQNREYAIWLGNHIKNGLLNYYQYKIQKENHLLENSNRKLSEFKDKHQGERCVIIGNGPSLNKMDLSFLKNEITFGMNRIYLGFEKWNFTPDYFVSVNPLVLEQSVEEIVKIPAPKFLSIAGNPHYPDSEDIIYLDNIDLRLFSKDPRQGIWQGYTVTFVAMQLAYFMGFQEIILIGVDHNFQTKGPANKEVVSKGDDPNHFATNYFGEGVRWHLPDLRNSEWAYRIAKKVFESENRKIWDATYQGHLNVFPKIDYQEAFWSSLQATQQKADLDQEDLETSSPIRAELPTQNKINNTDSQKSHKNKPKISVIVVPEERTDNLSSLISIINQQTYADEIETIILDHNLTSAAKKTINQTRNNHPKLQLLTKNPGYKYEAWNYGMYHAAGEYFTIISSKCILHHNALEKLATALDQSPHAYLAYAHYGVTTRPTQDLGEIKHQITCKPYHPAHVLLTKPVGGVLVWRQSAMEKIGIFDDRLGKMGVYEYLLRFPLHQLEAVLVPEVLSAEYYDENEINHNQDIPELIQQKITWHRRNTPINKLYEIDPHNHSSVSDAWVYQGNLALTYRIPHNKAVLNDYDYAYFCYQKAIESNPRNQTALNNIVALLTNLGRWHDAQVFLTHSKHLPLPELKRAVYARKRLTIKPVKSPPPSIQGSGIWKPEQTTQSEKVDISNAEETLKEILEAENIFNALEDNQDNLNSTLLSLVNQNIKKAQQNNQDDLAEGLEALAGFIQEKIHGT
jgi:FkbM family methyltransferase